MAVSQAAYAVEKAIGHDGSAVIQQDITNYAGHGDGNQRMKALVWQGKNKVEVVEVPKPKIIEDGDVILKVTGTTVCGSDLHLLHGTVVQLQKGDILGHEFCGIVESVGPAVKNIDVGGRYVASFQIACGDCFFCKKKLSSQCEKTSSNSMGKAMYGSQTAGIFGFGHFTGGEYVRVPIGDVNLLKIPDDVPDEKALYLSDVLATSYNCVKDTAVYPGDEVAVFGAGPIGQMAGIFALGEGASKVIFVDTEPRLSFVASRWPSAHKDKLVLVDFKSLSSGLTNKETVVSKLKEICGGRGPDCALECAAGEYAKGWTHWLEMQLGMETDTSEILNEMIEGVRNYGRCGITGIYVGYTNHLAIGSVMQRGIRLIGNGQAPVLKYWDHLLALIRKGELDPLQMVSHRFRLDDLASVYHAFDAKEDGMQKVFVETKFSLPRAPGSPELTRF
ncbi:alcohol dehydrogenase [Grosmannia clavigera kw1407]|uniref:Alcohol dehydrogenase n=1 Tax=Grosmannia clavigera (strain kw1407 / UAMH 11150) TaxID=655863 RepID=F0X6P2_GROCL|nr:alcohol dehydrogenase [Grosmannia clavigera kw1407]EFX06294.1 alcohol dehydrogenase [Grosmannia clavigera kw1407]